MFRDLLDNKLTPKPNQKGYSESVSEYLKEYVLFKSEFDIVAGIARSQWVFCRLAKMFPPLADTLS